jgi:chromate reductase
MTTIAVLVGSLRKDSYNLRLAKSVERLAPEGTEFVYANLNLPLFNQDLEADFPPEATALKQLVEGADGVLFVTPEYNRSFSGVLKNAIDWGSRPWGQSSFAGKPAALIGASGGALGATQAQAALRNVLVFLDTKLMGQPEVYFNALTGFDENGELASSAEGFIKAFAEAFVKHVESSSAAK